MHADNIDFIMFHCVALDAVVFSALFK